MAPEASNIALARTMLRAIEAGDVDALSSCYDAAVEQVEWPNRLKPKGDRRGLAQLLADFERGRHVLARQHYDVLAAVESGPSVALQVRWTGVLAIPIGSLAAGETMTVNSAMFLVVRDGRIVAQDNYDCFEPF